MWKYKFLFNGYAGSITVECVDEGDALRRGKVNAVGAAISSLSGTALQIADPDTPASDIDPLANFWFQPWLRRLFDSFDCPAWRLGGG
jgi:hypothetical protein